MASIALVHPVFLALDPAEREASSPYFPLGLLYLAGYVRDQGHDVVVFDGTFEPSTNAFVDFLVDNPTDLVGISALATTSDTALELAELAATRGQTVIFGGPDPTARPAHYLAHECVDLVVHHEGEQTIVELLDHVDHDRLSNELLGTIGGIAWRCDGRVSVNAPRPPIDDLDTLPLPARDLIDMERYLHQWQADQGYTSITVSTGRGCPWGCSWCAEAVHGDQWRQRSPESVAAEVQMLRETWNIDSVRVVDDVDGFDRTWVDSWAKAAADLDAAVPFEALQALERTDLPMLEVRDSL